MPYFFLPLFLPAYVIRFQIGPFPTTLLEVVIFLITGWWLATRKGHGLRDAWKRSRPWHGAMMLWLLAGAAAIAVSPLHVQALGLFRAYFVEPLLVFFIGFDVIKTTADRDRLWSALSITAMALGLWAVIQIFTGWGIPSPWDALPGRRATGPFPYPNALALFVAPIVALAGARIISRIARKDLKREAALFRDITTFILGLTAILAAQSDGGLIAVTGALFIAMLMHRQTRWPAVGIAIAGLIMIALIAPIRTHVVQTISFQDWSGMVRTVMWKESVAMLQDRPLLGAGLSAYPIAILPYHAATWMEVFQYPHNILLNLWSETGMLGIVAFVWILFVWLRQSNNKIIKQSGPSPMLHLALPVALAILIHGLVDVPYFKNDLAVAFWLLILLTTVYETRSHR